MKAVMALLLITPTLAAATPGFAQLTKWSLLQTEQIAGRQVFADHCASCHNSALTSLAPSLRGVIGRPAGSLPNFAYSDALKKSGLVWTEDNLRKWIGDSAHTVANTLVPHTSVSDPAEQTYLLAYLQTLKASGPYKEVGAR